jgi:hypothetical protein
MEKCLKDAGTDMEKAMDTCEGMAKYRACYPACMCGGNFDIWSEAGDGSGQEAWDAKQCCGTPKCGPSNSTKQSGCTQTSNEMEKCLKDAGTDMEKAMDTCEGMAKYRACYPDCMCGGNFDIWSDAGDGSGQ